MSNPVSNLTFDGTTYDLVDETSGYAKLASPAFTGTPTAPTATTGDSSTQIATTAFVQDAMSGAGAGTVTSVAVANDTDGGLSVSGSPITSSGTIKVKHSNVLTSAQTTEAVYPIKIDKNGHISSYGSAVTGTIINFTGITVDSHSTTTIYGVQSTTTTASKASGGNGSAPTLGTAFTVPNITAVGSGSFTQGTFSGGSLTMTMDTTDTKKLNITFTAATHGVDSHTHIAPTLGTAFTIPNITNVGSASTWSFSDVTVPIKNSSSTTVVTNGSHNVNDTGHTHGFFEYHGGSND